MEKEELKKEYEEGKLVSFSDNFYEMKILSEESDLFTQITSHIKDTTTEIQKNDNSESYVLDLGGGKGNYGVYATKILKAKKLIVYDVSESLINLGKSLYGDSVEYVQAKFEEVFEKEKSRTFCYIFVKEAIHFSNKDFYYKLLNFCMTNLKGKLCVVGIPRLANWIETPPYPPSALTALNNLTLDVVDCFEIAKKELIAEESEKKVSNINLVYKNINYNTPFDEFSTLLLNRRWSFFTKCSDEELQSHLEKLKEKNSSLVEYNCTQGCFDCEFK